MEVELTLTPFKAGRSACPSPVRAEAPWSAWVLEWNAPLRLPAGAGSEIRCDRGSVWITQDYDSRDIVLEAGERYVLEADTPALVQAFDVAEITVTRDRKP